MAAQITMMSANCVRTAQVFCVGISIDSIQFGLESSWAGNLEDGRWDDVWMMFLISERESIIFSWREFFFWCNNWIGSGVAGKCREYIPPCQENAPGCCDDEA
jgi:hypothetical protein